MRHQPGSASAVAQLQCAEAQFRAATVALLATHQRCFAAVVAVAVAVVKAWGAALPGAFAGAAGGADNV
jgi:hypothetical protein